MHHNHLYYFPPFLLYYAPAPKPAAPAPAPKVYDHYTYTTAKPYYKSSSAAKICSSKP